MSDGLPTVSRAASARCGRQPWVCLSSPHRFPAETPQGVDRSGSLPSRLALPLQDGVQPTIVHAWTWDGSAGMTAMGPACVKTQTSSTLTHYLYNFMPLYREIHGPPGLSRHEVAQRRDLSAFSHKLGQPRPFSVAVTTAAHAAKAELKPRSAPYHFETFSSMRPIPHVTDGGVSHLSGSASGFLDLARAERGFSDPGLEGGDGVVGRGWAGQRGRLQSSKAAVIRWPRLRRLRPLRACRSPARKRMQT
jgi:hypothetical protein